MVKSPWAKNGGKRPGAGRPKKLKDPRTVWLETPQLDQLRAEAKRKGVPVSDLIREAVTRYVKGNDRNG